MAAVAVADVAQCAVDSPAAALASVYVCLFVCLFVFGQRAPAVHYFRARARSDDARRSDRTARFARCQDTMQASCFSSCSLFLLMIVFAAIVVVVDHCRCWPHRFMSLVEEFERGLVHTRVVCLRVCLRD